MSKISDNFARAKKMLQADKAPMQEECKAMILQDLQRTLSEYFTVSGEIQLDTALQNGHYTVRIAFSADRIKNFALLK